MEDLKEIIEEGIVKDLYLSEQSFEVYNLIAKNYQSINKNEGYIIKSLIYLQQLSKNDSIISLSRILDRGSDRNKTRCIDSALEFIKKNYKRLHASNGNQVIEQLNYYGYPTDLIEALKREDNSCFNLKFEAYFQDKLLANSAEIKKVKTWRDKIIAHNEAIPKKIIIKTIELNRIFELGWELVSIIGLLYLDTIYGLDGEHTIKDQSRFRSFDFEKLFQELKIGG